MRYWLMKTEPETFSIADLARVGTEPWTGVRNYTARGFMRAMTAGDAVLFYHSSTEPPGVAGLATVAKTGVVDETQFDPDSPYYDPKATRDRPRWDCVDVTYVSTLPHYVSLAEIRAEPSLAKMPLLQRGQRLSVQPVTAAEYKQIVKMGTLPTSATSRDSTARDSKPRKGRTQPRSQSRKR